MTDKPVSNSAEIARALIMHGKWEEQEKGKGSLSLSPDFEKLLGQEKVTEVVHIIHNLIGEAVGANPPSTTDPASSKVSFTVDTNILAIARHRIQEEMLLAAVEGKMSPILEKANGTSWTDRSMSVPSTRGNLTSI